MTISATSRRVIAKTRTYDPHSITSAGWDLTAYADGRVAVEYHTRWQGRVTGERWTSEPGRIGPDDAELGLEMLTDRDDYGLSIVDEIACEEPTATTTRDSAGHLWRRTRRGVLIR